MIIWERLSEEAVEALKDACETKNKQAVFEIIKKNNATADCICLFSNEQLYGYCKMYFSSIVGTAK